MTIKVFNDDCLKAIPRLVAEGGVCDAVVTDPPYHLLPTVKRLAQSSVGGAQVVEQKAAARKDAIGRLAGGFMGQQWDGGDIAFRPETWVTVATILRPGAFLVAFGGTRTYHRLACAIEDGGFVIQDCIMWLFATGFPKRRDMLKPAYEPIVLAYKPGGKRTMQIDECRVGTGEDKGEWPITGRRKTTDVLGDFSYHSITDRSLGRWPANICHDGSDEVLAAFAAYGERPGCTSAAGNGPRGTGNGVTYASIKPQGPIHNDNGSAARFFFSAKADAQDRWGSRHPTVKPVELMKWLVALVTPPSGTCIDPFAGSGTTGVAALATGRNAILIEREDAYVADIRERMAHYEGGGRHSLASKARQAKPRGETPLFDPPYDETADAIGSYNDAVRAVGATIKEGAPVPAFFLSDKPEAAE